MSEEEPTNSGARIGNVTGDIPNNMHVNTVIHRINDTEHDTLRKTSTEELSRQRHNAKAQRQLQTAILTMDDFRVEEALRNGASPNEPVGSPLHDTWPILHYAIDKGATSVVRLLLEYQADPNAVTGDTRRTALHVAVHRRHLDMVKLLLQYDVTLNATDSIHQTAFDLALDVGHTAGSESRLINSGSSKCHRIASLLVAQDGLRLNSHPSGNPSMTALHAASELGWVDVLRELLGRDASITAQDEKGKVPLHFACKEGNVEGVMQLLDAGALPDVADLTGETPLHVAVRENNMAVMSELITRGARVNATDTKGRTPIFDAARNGNTEVVEALIGAGASTEAHDAAGRTPLHFAGAYNHAEVARQLVALGADVNAVAYDGSRPLHDAILYGSFNAIDQLREDGARFTFNSSRNDLNEPAWNRLLRLPLLGNKPPGMESFAVSAPAISSVEEADTAKVLYGSGGAMQENAKDFDMTGANEANLSNYVPKARRRKLLSILAFIENEFTEDQKKQTRGIKRMRTIPVIDIDLRKPYHERVIKRHARESFAEEESQRRNDKRAETHHHNEDDWFEPHDQFLKKVQNYKLADNDTLTLEESKHRESVKKLFSSYGCHGRIDWPISLDEYFHESIDAVDVNQRNGDQVISRFIARQRVQEEETREHQLGHPTIEAARGQTFAPLSERTQTPSRLETGLGGAGRPDVKDTEGCDKFRQRIITVPRLWAWKLDDNKLITSFPPRLDQASVHNDLVHAAWYRLTERTLNGTQEPGRESELDADDILNEIIQTYTDVFTAEIAFVSCQVSHFYSNYEASLGKGVKNFSQSIKLATEYLMTIEDIVNEMAMIRGVLHDQGRVLELLQSPQRERSPSSVHSHNSALRIFEGTRSDEGSDITERLKHLENDAKLLRKSISTLLDLCQRQVAIEMAMSSEKQSDILFRQNATGMGDQLAGA
ncbi:hypothetical protein Daus18300_012438 [Diaporthe australafricana]|uniref:Ankyrin repeat protein n=1 Tax=Diaporthe australafricana TaxID=127596 RepID=A0ABR3W366_9PEZI